MMIEFFEPYTIVKRERTGQSAGGGIRFHNYNLVTLLGERITGCKPRESRPHNNHIVMHRAHSTGPICPDGQGAQFTETEQARTYQGCSVVSPEPEALNLSLASTTKGLGTFPSVLSPNPPNRPGFARIE